MADVARLIRRHIDRAAAGAGQPSAAQKEAGNYRKGKLRIHGLDISIENPRGSKRSGIDKDGKPWSVTLPDHYGYIRRTEGSDGDHVDCYIGRHPMSSRVFVIDQVDADTGKHDEHKCLIGYLDKEQALSAYKRAFSDGRGEDRIGSAKEMDIASFKKWLQQEGGLPKYAAGGAVKYAEGGAPDLPDAPWATPMKAASPDLPDAPWGSSPTAAPSSPGLIDRGVEFAQSAAPYVARAASSVPVIGPAVSGATRAVENADPSMLAEAARNTPKSAVQFGKDLVHPIIHPVETAESLKNLGLGLLEKTGLASGTDHIQHADAVGRYFADRYGGIDNAKRAFAQDPVGVAGDLSMILTGGGSAAARLPGTAGRIAETVANVGRTIDPLSAVAPVVRGAGHAASEVLGVTTGAGGQPLRTAAHAGHEGGQAAEAFRDHLTGAAPMEQAVEDAKRALAQMRKERGDAYRTQMGPIKADSTVLDFAKIDNAVTGAQGVKTYSGRSGTGPAQDLHPKTEGIRKEMSDAVAEWKALDPAEFHTPEGIDALKQKLGDIRDATQPHTPDRVVADRIYNAVRQTIVDQVPEYAKVMKGYEQASKQLREIETTLSLKPGANIDTALRKLQSTLRDNVNTSFGRRTELANFLVNSGAPHLMEKLAGQALGSWMPRGLPRLAAAAAVEGPLAMAAGLGAAAKAIPALATMSPRIMGEAAYWSGKAMKGAEKIAPVPRISRQVGQVSRAADPYGGMAENPFKP